MSDGRAEVRRHAERGSNDRLDGYAILDESLVCHLGFAVDDQPFVIPVTFARAGDELIIHGSPASRLLRHFDGTNEAVAEVTILDGLVLARSAFNHSMNYRSVVCFGKPVVVDDLDERARLLDLVTDKLVPGRRPHLRQMTEKEVRGTKVIRMPIDAISVKVRSGGPGDREEADVDVWAGVVPMSLVAGTPVPADGWEDAEPPRHVKDLA